MAKINDQEVNFPSGIFIVSLFHICLKYASGRSPENLTCLISSTLLSYETVCVVRSTNRPVFCVALMAFCLTIHNGIVLCQVSCVLRDGSLSEHFC